MKTWRSPSSQMGCLTCIAMAWAQFCAGTGTPILENTITKLPHAEAKWIMSMRDFLTATQGTIELLDHSVAKLQRERDAFLIDIMLRDKRFRPAPIRRINFCRLYLNVLLISDICTATGDSIDPDMYSGATPKPQRAQKANQPSPTGKSWQQWKRLMHILCHGQHETPNTTWQMDSPIS
jgi:hypothetical protein